MANRNFETGEGFRKRSLSESDTERVSDTPLTPGVDVSNRQCLITDLELNRHASNPDISSPGSGLVDTPIGLGRGTLLRSGRNLPAFGLQEKVINDCSKIKKEVESWLLTIKANPPPPIDHIYESYERYKRRVTRINQEALVRRLDMSLTFGLAELLLKLEEVRKATSRRERKELNPDALQAPNEPDNVFVEDQLDNIELPVTPTEMNKSQSLSSHTSLTDTVSNIIDFVHEANLHISPVLQPSMITPPPPQVTTGQRRKRY